MEATSTQPPAEALPVKPLTPADLDWALKAGWDDFKDKRGDLLLVPLIYPVVGFIASAFAFNANLFPLLFPLVAGLSILGPAAAAGFYELARRREEGIDANWWHFLDPLKGRQRLGLAMLTAMLAVLFVCWLGAAYAIYQNTLGRMGPPTPAFVMQNVLTTSAGWTMIVAGNLVGLVFAVVTLAVSAISFPLIVDKGNADPLAAVMTSVAAFRRSPGAMLRWGAMVAAILLVGALPLFVGLAVALPVLGYATWHLYTRAVAR